MAMNNEILKEIITTPMPYGKYKGTIIADLPIYYLEWFSSQGFPKGKLGMLLSTVFEIKTNGLQEIIDNLKQMMGEGGRNPSDISLTIDN
jgi:putative cytoplasmic protein